MPQAGHGSGTGPSQRRPWLPLTGPIGRGARIAASGAGTATRAPTAAARACGCTAPGRLAAGSCRSSRPGSGGSGGAAASRILRGRAVAGAPVQVGLWAAGESACRPGSVHPHQRAGGHPSGTAVTGSLMRSTREHRAGHPLAQAAPSEEDAALVTLLRVGFTEPPGSLRALVVSYTTVSPLPRPGRSLAGAVCSLWHCPAGHPGSVLPTTLPCGARTFLTGSRLS
jgi:hypothetical protein